TYRWSSIRQRPFARCSTSASSSTSTRTRLQVNFRLYSSKPGNFCFRKDRRSSIPMPCSPSCSPLGLQASLRRARRSEVVRRREGPAGIHQVILSEEDARGGAPMPALPEIRRSHLASGGADRLTLTRQRQPSSCHEPSEVDSRCRITIGR